jgi:stress-induced morphogen
LSPGAFVRKGVGCSEREVSVFSAERIRDILHEKLPDCVARVRDDANGGEHFSAEVTSSAFAGLRMVQQHRLVYDALGAHMHRDIHALALKTYPPDRWPHGPGAAP